MSMVRPFVEADIPAVADMCVRTFTEMRGLSLDEVQAYFKEIFFHNPWRDPDLPSLIYEEEGKTVTGFLGVVPRRMRMNGRPIRVAVSFHFMVALGSRSSLAGIKLLKALLSGPQDLTLTDGAGDSGHKLWEGMGGTTALLYSLRWIRLLRPTRYLASLLAGRKFLAPVAWAARPACYLLDALAARVPQSPFIQKPQSGEEELSEDRLVGYLDEFSAAQTLQPAYDEQSLKWLLQLTAQQKSSGTFRKVAVRNGRGQLVGWYLYFVKPWGISTVIQLGARDDSIEQVLDHLFYHAWREGSIAVSGRLEPRFMAAFAAKGCLYQQGSWVLIHSSKRPILDALHRGDAFFTELEGEQCFHLRSG